MSDKGGVGVLVKKNEKEEQKMSVDQQKLAEKSTDASIASYESKYKALFDSGSGKMILRISERVSCIFHLTGQLR